MKRSGALVLLPLVLTLCASAASARDSLINLPIADAMSTEDAQSILGDEIKFYFGNQPHTQIIQDLGTVKTNRKTNAFMKSDEKACNWVFLSALVALRDRAIEMGADAVINIKSNYKHNETSSEKTFKCGAGNVVAGVALKGTMVKLGQ